MQYKLLFFSIIVLLITKMSVAQSCQDASIQLTATIQYNPASISLKWLNNGNATQFTVYRKLKTDNAWSNLMANLPDTATQFVDASVQIGDSYEYYVNGNFNGYTADGYINAGMGIAPIEDRGMLILMVDSLFTMPLASQITRLVADLAGDGWKVIRHDVSRNASVLSVKNLIVNDYNLHPTQTKAIFLLGHIPVPYSGNINPDGHPDHEGAWAADLYYADIDGIWTDISVNNTVAAAVRNQNIPGDGKFDQSVLPTDAELQIGRVDFYDLPAFATTETQLMQNYLDKDHDYKHKNFTVNHQALVDDNFGYFYGEVFAANAWKNFSPLVGTANVSSNDYFASMANNSYLWSYGCGGGTYTSAGGIGSTSDFATANLQSVFTMLFGSYFGDWDSQNNFLRAALAQGKTLTNCWAGRPHWALHCMALGENIGYSTLISQNNYGLYAYNYGDRMVHIALMGDPTLRNDVISPPANVSATIIGSDCQISWTASADTILGYYIYAKKDTDIDFVRITGTPVIASPYIHSCVIDSGLYTYMVRAIRLENTPSGTYYNLSQGITDTTLQNYNINIDATFFYTKNCNDVNFMNTSLGAITQIWDFGDGNTETSSNPQHHYANAGTYNATLIAFDDCTSDTISLPISIAPAITSSQNIQLCAGNSITVGSNTYSNSGIYTDILVAANGCDSIITTNLTVASPIDVTTTVNGFVISVANNPNASYTWVDCNGYTPISGANNADYTVVSNGSYAVIITIDGCSDTSACVNMNSISATENVIAHFSIYPNPTKGKITIETGDMIADKIWITDAMGKRVWETQPTSYQSIYYLRKKGFFFVFIEKNGKNTLLGKVWAE